MKECRDESEIYNYQRIQLLNNKFINGILAGGGKGGGGYASPGLTVKHQYIYAKHILISPAKPLF